MMKSKKVRDILELLEPDRIIDMPRKLSKTEVEQLVEIAELEAEGNIELIEEKVKEFFHR